MHVFSPLQMRGKHGQLLLMCDDEKILHKEVIDGSCTAAHLVTFVTNARFAIAESNVKFIQVGDRDAQGSGLFNN